MSVHKIGADTDSDGMTASVGADTPSAAFVRDLVRLSPDAAEDLAREVRALAEAIDLRRCPICGGLNPGDMSHTRCI